MAVNFGKSNNNKNMFITKNQKINELETRIEELEAAQRYHDFYPEMGWSWPAKKLTAQELATRFQEIYEILGYERTTTPEHTGLKKKPVTHKGKNASDA